MTAAQESPPIADQRRPVFSPSVIMGGRAFGPPLCRGCAPATPPYKTIAHRPCVLIPAVRLQQGGGSQPNTLSDSLHGGRVRGLVKTGTVDGLEVTRKGKTVPFGCCIPFPRPSPMVQSFEVHLFESNYLPDFLRPSGQRATSSRRFAQAASTQDFFLWVMMLIVPPWQD